MPNIVPHTMNDWMRRQELRGTETDQRKSNLVPRNIADAVNLDDFLWSGRYFRQSTTGTTQALGYPSDGAAGTLEVIRLPTSTQAQQVFYDRVAGVAWIRWYDGVSWGAWRSTGFTGDVYDTGWMDRSGDLNAGYTADGLLESRRIGATVWWRGRVDSSPDWGAAFTNHQIIDDLGAQWTPGFSDVAINASGAAAQDVFFRVVMNTAGPVQVRCSIANHTGAVYMTHRYISGEF